MVFLIFILVIFAVVFLLFYAASDDKKTKTVRRKDPETGKETIETQTIESPSSAKNSVRSSLGCLGFVVLIIVIFVLIVVFFVVLASFF